MQKSDGWSFKPRGRLMIDAGTISVPDGVDADDGFGSEARRARLGASGDLPGGFGYKFEFDLADDDIDVNDAILTYGAGDIEIAIGQHNTFQSLEELTSSLHSSFIERAAFTDAFGFERRIGASIEYSNGIFLGQAGVFTDNFADTGTDNRSVDGRVVLMPKLGDAQLHLGGSLHYNDLGEEDATVRYRQRPFVHFTSSRFVNTNGFNAESEFGTGLEAAVIAGPFHASAEGFWQKVDTPLAANPIFFGGYAEVGYFLTAGDRRGYKGGTFDTVKPANPLGDGGFGSLQINLRYDHLDLNDAGIVGGIPERLSSLAALEARCLHFAEHQLWQDGIHRCGPANARWRYRLRCRCLRHPRAGRFLRTIWLRGLRRDSQPRGESHTLVVNT